jgi:hypothetical protein
MKYEVVRGYAIHDGALHTKGSSFDAKEDEVQTELRKGIIVPLKKQPTGKEKPGSSE